MVTPSTCSARRLVALVPKATTAQIPTTEIISSAISRDMSRTLDILYLSVAFYLATLVRAQKYDFGFDVAKHVRRQTQDRVVIRGLPRRIDGSLVPRREIRDMQKDAVQFDLFLLALSMMQFADQDDRLSWYQIAGAYQICWTTRDFLLPSTEPC